MPLSDRAILTNIAANIIRIVPAPRWDSVQPTSVDLHLGPVLFGEGEEWTHDLSTDGDCYLHPGCFALGATLEGISLPTGALIGILVGKSSLARLGLQIEAAGYVDPGWGRDKPRPLTLELKNLTQRTAIRLQLGMKICQIRFDEVMGSVERLYGEASLNSHYAQAEGPQPAATDGVYDRPIRSDPDPAEENTF